MYILYDNPIILQENSSFWAGNINFLISSKPNDLFPLIIFVNKATCACFLYKYLWSEHKRALNELMSLLCSTSVKKL